MDINKEEEEWREWFEKECTYNPNEPLVYQRIKAWSRWAWFECGKRKDALINELEQAIKEHKRKCWPKEVYNGYDEELYKVLEKAEGK